MLQPELPMKGLPCPLCHKDHLQIVEKRNVIWGTTNTWFFPECDWCDYTTKRPFATRQAVIDRLGDFKK